MTPSQQACRLQRERNVFPHALWMEDAMVTSPCSLLLVHPDEPAAGRSVEAFGFYVLDEDEQQQAMQICAGRVMRCSFMGDGLRQCRIEIVEDGQACWFRCAGDKFKKLKHANQETDGGQLRPPCEG